MSLRTTGLDVAAAREGVALEVSFRSSGGSLFFRSRDSFAHLSKMRGASALVGAPYSVDRLGYAFIPATFAIAILLRRSPWLGYATLGVMSIDLFDFAAVFARYFRSLRVVGEGTYLRP